MRTLAIVLMLLLASQAQAGLASRGLAAVSANMSSIPRDGLVGYWCVDGYNSPTVAKDASGQGNDGVVVGSPSISGSTYSFDGLSDAITIEHADVFDTDSVCVFFYASIASQSINHASIITKSSGALNANSYQFDIDVPAQTLRLVFNNNGSNFIVSTGVALNNDWAVYAIQYNNVSGVADLYIDGLLKHSATNASFGSLSDYGSSGIYIASTGNNAGGVKNLAEVDMSHCAIYENTFSNDEIINISNIISKGGHD